MKRMRMKKMMMKEMKRMKKRKWRKMKRKAVEMEKRMKKRKMRMKRMRMKKILMRKMMKIVVAAAVVVVPHLLKKTMKMKRTMMRTEKGKLVKTIFSPSSIKILIKDYILILLHLEANFTGISTYILRFFECKFYEYEHLVVNEMCSELNELSSALFVYLLAQNLNVCDLHVCKLCQIKKVFLCLNCIVQKL